MNKERRAPGGPGPEMHSVVLIGEVAEGAWTIFGAPWWCEATGYGDARPHQLP